MTRLGLLACVALLAGCKGLPDACREYNGRTCISLAIDLAPGGPAGIDAIRIVPVRGITLASNTDESLPQGSTTPFPLLLAILPDTIAAGEVDIGVRGLSNGNVVGDVGFTTTMGAGDHASGRVALGPPMVDMATPLDLTPPPPPDLMTVPPCDPVLQTYCQPGQKCKLSNGTPTCVPTGTVGSRQTCQWSPDNCTAGAECYVDSQGPAWCEYYCNSNADCQNKFGSFAPWSGNLSWCHYATGSGSVKLCTTPCDPVLNGGGGAGGGSNGCLANTKCDVIASAIDGAPAEITSCEIVGTVTDGQNCTYNTDCINGYVCVGSGQGHCRAYCRSGTNSDCTAISNTYTCVVVTGWTHIGACCPNTGC